MVSRVGAIATTVATAVLATTWLATVVDAAPAPETRPARSVVTKHEAKVPATSPAALPSVTTHEVDPQVLAAATSLGDPGDHGGQSVVQVVQLSIIGGDLELVTDHATVTLQKVPGTRADWIGTLPPVRVIDARGTHEGWDVRWTVSDLDVRTTGKPSHAPNAKVHLAPDEPAVVDGLLAGLIQGKSGPGVRPGRSLFSAVPGSGGGTYEAGASLSVRLPASLDASSIVVELSFALS